MATPVSDSHLSHQDCFQHFRFSKSEVPPKHGTQARLDILDVFPPVSLTCLNGKKIVPEHVWCPAFQSILQVGSRCLP